MQKRKFDELISHFNRKVSEMNIDQKYKMELLGMISAIGFAHEKEHGTNLAEVGTDCISRQAAIYALRGYLVGKRCPDDGTLTCRLIENEVINKLPPIQPEPHWIPVEQALPDKEKKTYWVCLDGGGQCQCRWTNDVYGIGANAWSRWGWKKVDLPHYSEVLAWMPLPEPYKGVTE